MNEYEAPRPEAGFGEVPILVLILVPVVDVKASQQERGKGGRRVGRLEDETDVGRGVLLGWRQ